MFGRGEKRRGALVRLLYTHRNNGVVRVSIMDHICPGIDSSFLRHFWQVVVALAFEGPPIVGPRYLFITLRNMNAPMQRVRRVWGTGGQK